MWNRSVTQRKMTTPKIAAPFFSIAESGPSLASSSRNVSMPPAIRGLRFSGSIRKRSFGPIHPAIAIAVMATGSAAKSQSE